jgi:hypothetical protein
MIAAQLGLIVVGLLVVALGTLLIRSGRSTRNVIIGDVPGSATQTYAAPPPATSDSPNCDNWTSNSATILAPAGKWASSARDGRPGAWGRAIRPGI